MCYRHLDQQSDRQLGRHVGHHACGHRAMFEDGVIGALQIQAPGMATAYLLVDTIPRNSMGKALRGALAKQIRQVIGRTENQR